MYCNIINNKTLDDFPIGSIIIFPENTVFRIGIVVDLINESSKVKRINIIFGEYWTDDGKPNGITMNIYRCPEDCLLATKNDYNLEQVEYLISVYNKERNKNIKTLK